MWFGALLTHNHIYSNLHLMDTTFFLSGSLSKSNTGPCSGSDIVWWQFSFCLLPPHHLTIETDNVNEVLLGDMGDQLTMTGGPC